MSYVHKSYVLFYRFSSRQEHTVSVQEQEHKAHICFKPNLKTMPALTGKKTEKLKFELYKQERLFTSITALKCIPT